MDLSNGLNSYEMSGINASSNGSDDGYSPPASVNANFSFAKLWGPAS